MLSQTKGTSICLPLFLLKRTRQNVASCSPPRPATKRHPLIQSHRHLNGGNALAQKPLDTAPQSQLLQTVANKNKVHSTPHHCIMKTGSKPSVPGAFPSDLEMVNDLYNRHDVGSSLPNADEILGVTPADRRRASFRKTKFAVMILAGLIVVMAAGIGISKAGKRDSRKQLGGSLGSTDRNAKAFSKFLLNNRVSSKADLSDINSPQYKATKWMLEDDKYNWTLPEGYDIYHRDGYAFILRYILVSTCTSQVLGSIHVFSRHTQLYL